MRVRRYFIPLIQARNQILRLAAYDDETHGTQNPDKVTLLEAIQKLKQRLEQRDILEFQLRNIAIYRCFNGCFQPFGHPRRIHQIFGTSTSKIDQNWS